MSVDLWATMRAPISLMDLVVGARETTGLLLGVDDPPVIEVLVDRQWSGDELVHPGRRLAASELRSEVVGEHPGEVDTSARRWFRFAISTGDGASAVAFDHVDPSFRPDRTCAGVVIATALALTCAVRGGGEFVDINIFMLEPPESDPERVIELTRLPDTGQDFIRRCERYMRQFANQNGWPPDVSSAS
ncbi:hypothetical protein UK23_35015 [Lentzea aerocolonigenes]|uniref:Uncharacterized protein n=1 Tax=Lentzea aerocolonigenes TaxID=68170 RepID=A0A0F0GK93_LENAE|nr:hypothetical protein [Lentzea aerocolonigenes]KJK42986.1 hypothetical protein UK23_35015 [Lentzea aerocolonigenes]